MKVKIVTKSIKQGLTKDGNTYSIKSLYVNFQEKEVYDNIVNHLKSKGIADEQILKFCKPNEHNGNISYAFGLNCSDFTFDKVERFGILDAKIIFAINEKGYINAKIQIENKKEQVLSYEAPESEVDGWANGDNNVAESKEVPKDNKYNANVDNGVSNNNDVPISDLPF